MRRVHKVNKVMKTLQSMTEEELNHLFPQDKDDMIRDFKTCLAHDDEYLEELYESFYGEVMGA